MKPLPLSLGLLSAAVILLAACSDKSSESSPKEKSPSVATQEKPAQTSKASDKEESIQVTSQKLSGYIQCYNALDPMARRSIGRYQSWVKDMEAGPGGRGVVYGLYSISNEKISECGKSFAELQQSPPELSALDQSGQAYVQALTVLGRVVKTANTYYERENYKDDDFAQGRALHAELKPAFEAFEVASNRFSGDLEKANTVVQLQRLELIEAQEGKSLNYWTALQSIRAKEMVDILLQENFSLDEANRAFTEFELAVDSRNDLLGKSQGNNSTGRIPATTEELRQSAKGLIRRVRDKTPYRDTDIALMNGSTGWMVQASPTRVLYDYNNFVAASNQEQ